MTSKMYFILGLITVLFVLPLLYSIGVPSFDLVFVYLFGEGSILAVVFSLVLIVLILQGVRKVAQ